MNIFSQIGQRVLEKSRAYYFPVQKHSEADWESLTDEAFAAMLKEIDAFSARFSPPCLDDPGAENPLDKNTTLPGSIKR